MEINNVQYIFLGITLFILGLFVLIRNPRKPVNIAFFLMSFNFATWIISLFFLLGLSTNFYLVLRGRLVFTACIFIPASILHFSRIFPNGKLNLKEAISIYLIPSILLPITITPLVIKDVRVMSSGIEPILGPFYGIVLLYIVFYIALSLYFFIKKYRLGNKIEKSQILSVMIGVIFALAFGTFTNLILNLFGFKNAYKLGPWGTVVMMSFILYSILRYRIMDIELVIKRTTLYLGFLGVITILYLSILTIPYNLFGNQNGPRSLFMLFAVGLIFSFTFQWMREWLDKITDKYFYQSHYDYYKVLEKTSRELSSVVKLQDVLDVVTRPLVNEMHLKGVGIYLREKSGKISFGCLKKEGQLAQVLPDSVNDENPLIAFLIENKAMIESGEFRHKYGHLYTDNKILDPEKARIQEALDVTFQAGLVLPIVLKQNLIGLMILGEKKSGDQFTSRDLALLETISSQMAITIENTKLYEQMLNNERLTVLGSMSASIAHEIRNPLAAIKTFVQMLPFKYEKPEFRRRFDEVIPSEIERLSRITEDLLNFARPSPPAMTPTDVNVLLERVTTLLANQMRKKAIIVEEDYGEVPLILADSQQLTQVFMNLVLNAVQASHDASRIFITTRLKTLLPNAGSEQKVFISIRDEGVGIKKGDMVSIFEPYFTTKHEGTGLGLATTKRIIDAHKGEIEVDSQEGQGATFTVILPFNPAPTLANRK